MNFTQIYNEFKEIMNYNIRLKKQIFDKAIKIDINNGIIDRLLKDLFGIDINSKNLTTDYLYGKNGKNEYDRYLASYFHTSMLLRNEILKNNNEVVKYSYFFNLLQFVELVLKYPLIYSINNLSLPKKNKHYILSILQNNKSYYLSLCNQEQYNFLFEELNKIKKLVNTYDLQQAFRFPNDLSFTKDIIQVKKIDIRLKQLKIIIKEHKTLCYILLIIYSNLQKQKLIETLTYIESIENDFDVDKFFKFIGEKK